ncbi:MAG: trimeric intracellular cation channel family protein [Hydrogenovibrio sp.]|uniref:trimeric intracellular cation channel family protein n=1 Tax=Hydrogenovibrio sp. TaxID=2065821 RepID=UPI0028704C20|nr:trimeric intracellular cation channel family protein [Hydrogenovibrio sp.]MDR9497733.1 trimeric intracellular cation channel family protein [Hydrogenovibrio sp.]
MTLAITLHYLDLLGTVAFAMTGLLAANRKQLDLFGAIVIAMVTAVGGGTLRDLILDQPVFWVGENLYIYVVVVTTLLMFAYARLRTMPMRWLMYLDALGLATFSVIGAQKAMALGHSDPIVIMAGIMSGVVGGMIRDVLMGEVPLILRKEIYATASFLGLSLLLLLIDFGLPQDWALVVSVLTILALRVIGLVFNIGLPVFRFAPHADK